MSPTVKRGLPRELPALTPAQIALNTQKRLARTLGGREEFTGFMGDGVIQTGNVADAAITDGAATSTGGLMSLSGSSETTLATRTFTTTGGELEVDPNFHLTLWHPTAGGIDCRIRVYRGATVIFDKTFSAIGGDNFQGWQRPRVIETPAAGTYTYSVTAQASNSGWSTADVDAATIVVREFKR